MGGNNADGSCKSSADWNADFTALRTFYDPSGQDNQQLAVRLFASSDCNTIANVVRPAIDNNVKILAGVWTEDWAHFDREKNALNAAVTQFGCDWLAGVSVGSEDLYRKETVASTLAMQIYDVRGMVRQYGGSCAQVPVGHTDTWTAWVDPANQDVINAVDMLITDGYPYWQGSSIDNAQGVFAKCVQDTINVAQGKEVWVGETGWPTAGGNQGSAVPSVTNLQTYWRMVACPGGPLYGMNYFWFSAFDAPSASPGVESNFGIADSNRKLKINLQC